jgi:hypothetical protein
METLHGVYPDERRVQGDIFGDDLSSHFLSINLPNG